MPQTKQMANRALFNHINALLLEIADSIGALQLEILWENENPTAAFGAQQITLNRMLDAGEMILLLYVSWADTSLWGELAIGYGSSNGRVSLMKVLNNNSNSTSGKGSTNGSRLFTVYRSVIDFDACHYGSATRTDYCKPLYVLGFKPSRFKLAV